MKKILFFTILFLPACFTQAQRFFYIESGNGAEMPLKEDLLKSFQYVAKSPIMSDYIIKTDISGETPSGQTTIKITLEDSATLTPIFETSEEYAFGIPRINARILVNIAMKTLIEKNINQILLCTRNEHRDAMAKWVKLKKDKT